VKFKKILLYLYIYNRVGEMSSSAASAILFDEIGAAIRLQQQIRANHARQSEEADAKALADGDSEDSETGEDDSSATDDDSEEGDVDVEEASDSDSEEDE
jgi:hypothetical protein